MNNRKNNLKQQLRLNIIIFFLCSCLGAYFLGKESILFSSRTLNIAKLIPKEAIAIVSLTTDTKQWQKLQKLGTLESQSIIQRWLKLLPKQLDNYQTQIQPWLSDQVTISYLGLISQPERTTNLSKFFAQQSLVIILPIKNIFKLKNSLNNLQNQAQFTSNNSLTKYRGIEIKTIKILPEQQVDYSIALLNNYIIIANNNLALQQVIDTYYGSPSIMLNKQYKQSLAYPKQQANLVSIYLNIPETLKISTNYTSRFLTPREIEQQNKSDLALNINLEANKIYLQGQIWHQKAAQYLPIQLNLGAKLTQFLPQKTGLLITGENLASIWHNWHKESESNPLLPVPPKLVPLTVKSNLGLDWQKNILAWMEEPFILAKIASNNQLNSSKELNNALILWLKVKEKNRFKAIQSLSKLEKILATKYKFKIQYNGKYVTWTAPKQNLEISHSWLKDKSLLVCFGAPVIEQLLTTSPTNIQNNPLYQELVLSRLKNRVNLEAKPSSEKVILNNTNLFIDLDRLRKTDNSSLLPVPSLQKLRFKLPPQPKIFLNAIQAISFSSTLQDQQRTSFTITIKLHLNETNHYHNR